MKTRFRRALFTVSAPQPTSGSGVLESVGLGFDVNASGNRLRFLDASAITARFSDFLTEREMRDLLHRRNNVLLYLDRLVESQVRACVHKESCRGDVTTPPTTTGIRTDGDRVLISAAIHAVCCLSNTYQT